MQRALCGAKWHSISWPKVRSSSFVKIIIIKTDIKMVQINRLMVGQKPTNSVELSLYTTEWIFSIHLRIRWLNWKNIGEIWNQCSETVIWFWWSTAFLKSSLDTYLIWNWVEKCSAVIWKWYIFAQIIFFQLACFGSYLKNI